MIRYPTVHPKLILLKNPAIARFLGE